MKLEKLTFVEGEEGVIPETVTVTMNIREAVNIAKVFGKFSGESRIKDGLFEDEIYDCLVSDVFNRYWEDGYEGAIAELK